MAPAGGAAPMPPLPPPELVPADAALDAAARTLPVGGLLHGPTFSLHDAMLAAQVDRHHLIHHPGDLSQAAAGEQLHGTRQDEHCCNQK